MKLLSHFRIDVVPSLRSGNISVLGNQDEGVKRGEGSREDDMGKLSAILLLFPNNLVTN